MKRPEQELHLAVPAKPHKYGAQRTTVDGQTFASKGEAARWCELMLLWRSGEVRNILRQVVYPLNVKGIRVGTYCADFSYQERIPGSLSWRDVVEDFKGVRTEVYRLKKRLMLALYGVEIRETGRATRANRRTTKRAT